MNASDLGASDGSIGIDHVWKRKLSKLLAEAPMPASLSQAVQTLVDVDLDDLEAVIEGKREECSSLLYSDSGGFRLPSSYPVDFAVAIYVYTLADPPVFRVVNTAMFNPSRRQPGASANVSADLQACLPYIKFLDTALAALPQEYLFKGEVRRGVQWVYPSPDTHDPKRYFAEGGTVMWYEFKSTSERQEVMTRSHFCGVNAGPEPSSQLTLAGPTLLKTSATSKEISANMRFCFDL